MAAKVIAATLMQHLEQNEAMIFPPSSSGTRGPIAYSSFCKPKSESLIGVSAKLDIDRCTERGGGAAPAALIHVCLQQS